MIDRDELSDIVWKWRCKLSSKTREKRLSDYSIDTIDHEKAALSLAKESTFGVDATVKNFYEGKNSGNGHYDWVDYPPKQLSKSAAKAQDRVAIKVYMVKDREKPVISNRFALKHHMIEIQNPLLVAALKDIVKKEDVHLEASETATFKEPFRPLYFCYDEISRLEQRYEEGSAMKSYLRLFLRVLDEIFGDKKAHLKRLQASGLISYKLAWMYFRREYIVYSWGKNCEVLCKVVNTHYQSENCSSNLIIKCKILTFDGEAFVWRDNDLKIPQFEGNLPITDLQHYPLEFHKDPEGVKTRLLVRSKKVLDFQGLTYCMYSGIGIYMQGEKMQKHNVDGRILVDTWGFNKHHLAQGSRESKDPESEKNKISGTGRAPPATAATGAMNTSNIITRQGSDKNLSLKRLSEDEMKKNKEAMLAKEKDLIFMSPLLDGYSLKNKLWMSFYVDDIQPMVWNDEAYDHLVYDEQQKDLVLSFVENHQRTRHGMEDVIMGKGQGLVLLLSGPPGTGKTLTAEAVADRTRRPLFYLQAEDLGINAAALGANIKKFFEMATEWDAVILLDEADVFMAERSPSDIARNELVSIFLRELEYFRGILFLTTNLYDTIDTAFRSRVNIHLLFNPLGPDSRMLLWRKFLNRIPPMKGKTENPSKDLTEEDLKELAEWSLNGREIKNAVKMVRSWCDAKEYDMTLPRLESGIKVTAPHTSKNPSYDKDLYET